MSFDSEYWSQFLQDNWMIAAVVILAIIVVVKLVKTVMKWVLVAAIVIGFAVYGGYSIDDLKEVGSKVSEMGDKVTDELKDQAIKTMAGEAAEAKYVDNADGSYSITTSNLELNGVPNTGKVSVKLRGVSLGNWDMEGQVREFVTQSRQAAK
ncbi:hypothetical protein [Cohnella sp. GCM10027633]|uniref:hypothetical protein n=1 Tax=unclassified Cohnella TaxID=2636738 RepID=UPI00362C93B6